MSSYFGDESEKFIGLSRRVRPDSKPYNYEEERVFEGLSRTDAKSIIASSVFALVVTASFIHAPEIRDSITSVSEFPSQVEDKVVDGLSSLTRN